MQKAKVAKSEFVYSGYEQFVQGCFRNYTGKLSLHFLNFSIEYFKSKASVCLAPVLK